MNAVITAIGGYVPPSILTNKKISDEKEIKILSENTEIMQLWIKNNPKKGEDFLRFKDGFEASLKSK